MVWRIVVLGLIVVGCCGCTNAKPGSAKTLVLVANDDAITAKAGETVTLNLLETDQSLKDGEKFLQLGVSQEEWGKPGELLELGWRTGEIKYKVPAKPGVYTINYFLYGHDASLSMPPDAPAPPKPVRGKLIVTVE